MRIQCISRPRAHLVAARPPATLFSAWQATTQARAAGAGVEVDRHAPVVPLARPLRPEASGASASPRCPPRGSRRTRRASPGGRWAAPPSSGGAGRRRGSAWRPVFFRPEAGGPAAEEAAGRGEQGEGVGADAVCPPCRRARGHSRGPRRPPPAAGRAGPAPAARAGRRRWRSTTTSPVLQASSRRPARGATATWFPQVTRVTGSGSSWSQGLLAWRPSRRPTF